MKEDWQYEQDADRRANEIADASRSTESAVRNAAWQAQDDARTAAEQAERHHQQALRQSQSQFEFNLRWDTLSKAEKKAWLAEQDRLAALEAERRRLQEEYARQIREVLESEKARLNAIGRYVNVQISGNSLESLKYRRPLATRVIALVFSLLVGFFASLLVFALLWLGLPGWVWLAIALPLAVLFQVGSGFLYRPISNKISADIGKRRRENSPSDYASDAPEAENLERLARRQRMRFGFASAIAAGIGLFLFTPIVATILFFTGLAVAGAQESTY